MFFNVLFLVGGTANGSSGVYQSSRAWDLWGVRYMCSLSDVIDLCILLILPAARDRASRETMTKGDFCDLESAICEVVIHLFVCMPREITCVNGRTLHV